MSGIYRVYNTGGVYVAYYHPRLNNTVPVYSENVYTTIHVDIGDIHASTVDGFLNGKFLLVYAKDDSKITSSYIIDVVSRDGDQHACVTFEMSADDASILSDKINAIINHYKPLADVVHKSGDPSKASQFMNMKVTSRCGGLDSFPAAVDRRIKINEDLTGPRPRPRPRAETRPPADRWKFIISILILVVILVSIVVLIFIRVL